MRADYLSVSVLMIVNKRYPNVSSLSSTQTCGCQKERVKLPAVSQKLGSRWLRFACEYCLFKDKALQGGWLHFTAMPRSKCTGLHWISVAYPGCQQISGMQVFNYQLFIHTRLNISFLHFTRSYFLQLRPSEHSVNKTKIKRKPSVYNIQRMKYQII